jgi:hypothetical protein
VLQRGVGEQVEAGEAHHPENKDLDGTPARAQRPGTFAGHQDPEQYQRGEPVPGGGEVERVDVVQRPPEDGEHQSPGDDGDERVGGARHDDPPCSVPIEPTPGAVVRSIPNNG